LTTPRNHNKAQKSLPFWEGFFLLDRERPTAAAVGQKWSIAYPTRLSKTAVEELNKCPPSGIARDTDLRRHLPPRQTSEAFAEEDEARWNERTPEPARA